jgi:S-adenosylmethionine:diacylglycerol 3-amino-3-carboxypropyl transferase
MFFHICYENIYPHGRVKICSLLILYGHRVWRKFLQPGRQHNSNIRRAIKRTVLLETLVQQGHKVKKKNVNLKAKCKKKNSLLCSVVLHQLWREVVAFHSIKLFSVLNYHLLFYVHTTKIR